VRARAKGRKREEILVGNAALLDAAGIDYGAQQDQAQAWAEQGKTPVFVAVDGVASPLFAIADQARAGAKEAIALLHRLGLKP
jgi:Cu+-exporting ATPase